MPTQLEFPKLLMSEPSGHSGSLPISFIRVLCEMVYRALTCCHRKHNTWHFKKRAKITGRPIGLILLGWENEKNQKATNPVPLDRTRTSPKLWIVPSSVKVERRGWAFSPLKFCKWVFVFQAPRSHLGRTIGSTPSRDPCAQMR